MHLLVHCKKIIKKCTNYVYVYFTIESKHVGFRSIDCSDRNMRIRRIQAPYRKGMQFCENTFYEKFLGEVSDEAFSAVCQTASISRELLWKINDTWQYAPRLGSAWAICPSFFWEGASFFEDANSGYWRQFCDWSVGDEGGGEGKWGTYMAYVKVSFCFIPQHFHFPPCTRVISISVAARSYSPF
jgi:hypothetical protein